MSGQMSVSSSTSTCDWSTEDCDGSAQYIGGQPPKDPSVDEEGKVCRATIDTETKTCHSADVSSDEVRNEPTARDRAAKAYEDCVETYDGDETNYCRDATARNYLREKNGEPEPDCEPLNASCEKEVMRAEKKRCGEQAKRAFDQCMEDGALMADINCEDGTLPDGRKDTSGSRVACREQWRDGIPTTDTSVSTATQNSTSLQAGPPVGKVGVGRSVTEGRGYSEQRSETMGYAKRCAGQSDEDQTECSRRVIEEHSRWLRP